MVIEITNDQLDTVTADYNRAFAKHKQLAAKGLLESANSYMVYADCIETTMRAFGFIPIYNRDYDPYTGENFVSGWHMFSTDGE